MSYLTYVWKIILTNPSIMAVLLGIMVVSFSFLRFRWKWWLYPTLLSLTILAIPMIHELCTTWFSISITTSMLAAYLGYWNDILILIAFRERFGETITLLFTLGILNRMFTFWGYVLCMPLNTLLGTNINIRSSVTLVIVIMYLIISLLSWFTLRNKGRQLIQTQIHRHNWAILAGIAVSAKLIIDLYSNYAFELNPYSDINIIWAMITLCTFAISVLCLYLYSTITTLNHSELQAAADRLIFEKEAQHRYYETQLHNQDELRRIKHDMKGHLTIVSRLLEENKKDEAIEYLTHFSDYISSHQKKIYSQDPYLNAVVTNYATLFIENNIHFEYYIQPGMVEQHYIKMCLALNNGLQNALEASLKLPSEQRFVKLQFKIKQGSPLFRITNRFDGELIIDSKVPRSTKNTVGHGYGLLSIKEASESLGGFFICKQDGDMFVLDVAM